LIKNKFSDRRIIIKDWLKNMSDPTVVSLQVFTYVISLVMGFILGRITSRDQSASRIDAKGSFFKPEVRQKKDVVMNERTFVTAISTDSLEKKSGELGMSTTIDDDVSVSASKLAQLKKKV